MFIYKINVYRELTKQGWTNQLLKTTLAEDGKPMLNSTILTKLRRGEMVSLKTLDKICELLNLQPGDIIEYVSKEQFKMLIQAGYYENRGFAPKRNT